MEIRRLVIAILSFACLSICAQDRRNDCRRYIGGCFMEQKGDDTLVLFRGLQYWIEADLKRHEVDVYNISFINGCNFSIVLNTRLSPHFLPMLDPPPPSFRSTGYAFSSVGENSIAYYYLRDSTHKITLTPINDSDAWKYLIDADTLLYSDTSEIKKIYGMPIQVYSDNVPDFVKNNFDTNECRFADYMFSLLASGDITPCIIYATPILQRNNGGEILKEYNKYVQTLYGKLEDYRFLDKEETYFSKQMPPADKFIFLTKFSKVSKKIKICLSVCRFVQQPLISFNVIAEDPSSIPFLDTLTSPFRLMLKKQQFKKIYQSCTPELRSKVSYEEVKKNLVNLYNRGHLDEYICFFQNFHFTGGKSALDLSYKCTINGKTSQMDLTYTNENGIYILAGLNASLK